MAYCTKCGAYIADDAKFCPSCGEAHGAQMGTQQPVYNGQPVNSNYGGSDAEENKGISILCYFGLLLLIPYLTKPNSQFVKFHSNQGLVFMLFGIALSIVAVIPILGWIVAVVGGVFSVVCWILGIINVCKGEMKPLPLIGKITILK